MELVGRNESLHCLNLKIYLHRPQLCSRGQGQLLGSAMTTEMAQETCHHGRGSPPSSESHFYIPGYSFMKNSRNRDLSATEEVGRAISPQAMPKESRGTVERQKVNDKHSVSQISINTIFYM